MRISLAAMAMAFLLAAAMAFAQDNQAQPSDQSAPDNSAAPAQMQPDNTAPDEAAPAENAAPAEDNAAPSEEAVPAEPTQVAPSSGPISQGTTVEGQGVTIEGNQQAAEEGVEGVPAVHYEISEVGEQRGGSLLPDEPYDHISGTLSSWDTNPTGVYKDSRKLTGSAFPLAAAPAIDLHDHSLLPLEPAMPPSMSGNISSWDTAPTAAYKDYKVMVGSPFPMSADPSIRLGKDKMADIDEGANFSRGAPFPDTQSVFPTAAAPPRRQWW